MKRLAALLLTAATLPMPGPRDAHIQSVAYEPDQVVTLTGALGWQIDLEFAPDERIENVALGDAFGWQVTPNRRASRLFLKPLSAHASTNLTVATDRRRYAFALDVGPRRPATPWVVRFDPPHAVVTTVAEPPPPPEPTRNFGYAVGGDAVIAPARVWDDGRLTYFAWAVGAPVPAIFAGAPRHDEALVNSVARGRVTMVQQLAPRFTLRLGARMATVTATTVSNPAAKVAAR